MKTPEHDERPLFNFNRAAILLLNTCFTIWEVGHYLFSNRPMVSKLVPTITSGCSTVSKLFPISAYFCPSYSFGFIFSLLELSETSKRWAKRNNGHDIILRDRIHRNHQQRHAICCPVSLLLLNSPLRLPDPRPTRSLSSSRWRREWEGEVVSPRIFAACLINASLKRISQRAFDRTKALSCRRSAR